MWGKEGLLPALGVGKGLTEKTAFALGLEEKGDVSDTGSGSRQCRVCWRQGLFLNATYLCVICGKHRSESGGTK